MGARLAAYYAEAEGLGGLDGKIQLAMLTRIPSTRALVEPDSPDNVSKFEGAMSALRRARHSAVHNSNSSSAAGLASGSFAVYQNTSSVPAAAPFSERVTGTHRKVADGEELFWGVLGSLHDSLVGIFDRNANCLLVWESRSLEQRYPPKDGVSTVRDTFARLISERYTAEIRTVFEGSGVFQSELSCSIHGKDAWLSVSLSAAHDDSGVVLGVHAFIQDITEQKRHEAALKRSEARLRQHTRVYVDLVSQKFQTLDDVEESLRRITEAAAVTLEVARASVWFYEQDKTRLICADLFLADRPAHEHGLALDAMQYPAYFEAVREAQSLPVHDAQHDPRTEALTEPYLRALGITSLLDVPIWVHGEMVGVICHEHVGPARVWTADEENFAYMMASFVSLTLQLGQREE